MWAHQKRWRLGADRQSWVAETKRQVQCRALWTSGAHERHDGLRTAEADAPRKILPQQLIRPFETTSGGAGVTVTDANHGAVEGDFVTFTDGSQQAVLVVYTIKDGKIIRSETGATNIPK